MDMYIIKLSASAIDICSADKTNVQIVWFSRKTCPGTSGWSFKLMVVVSNSTGFTSGEFLCSLSVLIPSLIPRKSNFKAPNHFQSSVTGKHFLKAKCKTLLLLYSGCNGKDALGWKTFRTYTNQHILSYFFLDFFCLF